MTSFVVCLCFVICFSSLRKDFAVAMYSFLVCKYISLFFDRMYLWASAYFGFTAFALSRSKAHKDTFAFFQYSMFSLRMACGRTWKLLSFIVGVKMEGLCHRLASRCVEKFCSVFRAVMSLSTVHNSCCQVNLVLSQCSSLAVVIQRWTVHS